jgi:zinc transport system permease protein
MVMPEFIYLPYMQRALLGGILVGFLASYYGVFVIQRKLSFLGSGLAHAAFGGIALGILLSIEPLWVAVPFTILVAAGIAWVSDKTELGGDTAVGIFFSVSMALGIIFLFLKRTYTSDAFSYLFGSILVINWTDILITSLVVIITLFTGRLWKQWAYTSFDRELAQSDRIPVKRDDYLLSILIAVTVVVAIKLVGIVLIAAFLVIPAAAARLISHTFRSMTIVAITLGITGVVVGLIISYYFNLPSGATIILLQALVFASCMMLKSRNASIK